MGAMADAVARDGYESTTLRELVALAGVSNTTFYEHFETLEDCFLATFDEIVAQASRQVGEAYRSETGFRERLRAALEMFMKIVIAEPAAAHLVVVDSLSLGAAGVAHREPAADAFELMFRQSFDQVAERGEVSDMTIRAINAGIRWVVDRHLRNGQTERLRDHVDELLDWGISYQRPYGARSVQLPISADTGALQIESRPSSGDQLSWDEPPDSARSRSTLSQFERIVRAAALVSARDGYGKLSIPAISGTAGVSNQTFYEHFAGKEEAFLAALDVLGPRMKTQTNALRRGAVSQPEAIATEIGRLLSTLAENPILARVTFFEAVAAGPAARDRIGVMMDEWMSLIRIGGTDMGIPLREVVIQAIVGGIWAVIQHEIAHNRIEELPAILREITYIALAPLDRAEKRSLPRRGATPSVRPATNRLENADKA